MISRLLAVLLPAGAVLAQATSSSSGSSSSSSSSTSSASSTSSGSSTSSSSPTPSVDLSWHAPGPHDANDLDKAVNGTGVYGFIFNSSQTPSDVPYATYNWCNMPHTRREEYPPAPEGMRLKYVELIHRHHKRTPYAANTFPVESYGWSCADAALFYFGAPRNPTGNASAQTFWNVVTNPNNPFTAPGFPGDCEFPQLTRGGLDDAWQHGRDLYGVYHDLLGLIPDASGSNGYPAGVSFRVTNNVITSQVAGMAINGAFAITDPASVDIQRDGIDSLEPTYSCPGANALASAYGVGSTDPTWQAHLRDTSDLFSRLDGVSGISPTSTDWHQSSDNYFDNLSARLSHAKPLPCSTNNTNACVTPPDADAIFRLGEWEYAWLYRAASPQTLSASAASFGVWVAELAANLRAARAGDPSVGVYRHNVAHDGSVSRLLSILQLDDMVWPGMGAEVVFELWQKDEDWFVRILWGGRVLVSSSPAIDKADAIPLDALLAYFDGLVGLHAELVPGKCSPSS